MTDGERFIFVGGAPRSGTTLVQNILDCHPQIWGGPEFLHLPDIVNLRCKLLESVRRGWIDIYVASERVDELTRTMVKALLLPAADRAGKRLLSEKSPQNVLAFPGLLNLFPASRVVHVVRDPRAVVASLLQVGARAKKKGVKSAPYTYTCAAAIAYTRKCLEAGFAATRGAPGRIHTMMYEQLVQDPDSTLRALCAYLGVEWAEQMLRPGEVQHAGENAITRASDEVWYDKNSYQRNIDTLGLDAWQRTLTPAQQHEVTDAFADNADLRELGYRLEVTALPPIDLVTRMARVGRRVSRAAKRDVRHWLLSIKP